MHLEQLHVAVQCVNQPNSPNQLMHGPNASTAHRTCAAGNLIVDISGSEHRVRARIEKLASQTFFDPALEIAYSLS
jgi:hypothetical protein